VLQALTSLDRSKQVKPNGLADDISFTTFTLISTNNYTLLQGAALQNIECIDHPAKDVNAFFVVGVPFICIRIGLREIFLRKDSIESSPRTNFVLNSW
jgi:hypothetical protein